MRDGAIAQVIARFQANFDPHRFDAAGMETVIGTWSEQLWAVDDAIGARAADLIIGDPERRAGGLDFPTVAEFRVLCQRMAESDSTSSTVAEGDGQTCLHCTGNRVLFTEETKPALLADDGSGRELRPAVTYEYVQPCPMCRPSDWQYQRDGHLLDSHDVRRCDHSRCQQRAEHYAKTRHR